MAAVGRGLKLGGACAQWCRVAAATARSLSSANVTSPATSAASMAKQSAAEDSSQSPLGAGLGTVRDILMSKGEKFYSTTGDALVIDAVKEMVKYNIGSLIIIDEMERPVGIVTERDYMEKVIVRGRSSKSTLVREIMSEKEFTYVTPSAGLAECMEKMASKRIRHVPVIEKGSVLGMLSVGDIVRELVSEHKRRAEHLQSYIDGSY